MTTTQIKSVLGISSTEPERDLSSDEEILAYIGDTIKLVDIFKDLRLSDIIEEVKALENTITAGDMDHMCKVVAKSALHNVVSIIEKRMADPHMFDDDNEV